ncbi:hypothetical protein [Robiginitomaculum antarcticum]|uniref:hypothetical protein n=1 Tax=Robiginitomaculum antarcticum TaxID=437507 RepID=UPI00035F9558|nr:hypothetical protein [Robiginitomaculum antarcticum]
MKKLFWLLLLVVLLIGGYFFLTSEDESWATRYETLMSKTATDRSTAPSFKDMSGRFLEAGNRIHIFEEGGLYTQDNAHPFDRWRKTELTVVTSCNDQSINPDGRAYTTKWRDDISCHFIESVTDESVAISTWNKIDATYPIGAKRAEIISDLENWKNSKSLAPDSVALTPLTISADGTANQGSLLYDRGHYYYFGSNGVFDTNGRQTQNSKYWSGRAGQRVTSCMNTVADPQGKAWTYNTYGDLTGVTDHVEPSNCIQIGASGDSLAAYRVTIGKYSTVDEETASQALTGFEKMKSQQTSQ